jgi:hypothetical protein
MWDRIEASPYTTALLRRDARIQMLRKVDPGRLADSVVSAVERNARPVRPRRATVINMLSESPRRMTGLILAGVPFDVD